MIKKIFKYALFSILFLMTFVGIQEVKAEKYTGQAIWPSEHIANIFIKKIKPDGYTKYQQARFIRRSEDNKFVYCLQPYTDIDNNLPYYDVIRSDYTRVLGFTEEQWNKISLLAYYGYAYNENGYDHNAQKWYAITQVAIWRTTNPESRIVFTDTLNGNINESKFASELAELESLVNNHYKTPNFNSDNLTIPLGQSVTLTDSNNLLRFFKVSSTENAIATINGNELTITTTGIGEAKVNLAKKATSYEIPPIVYFSDHSQNVFRVGQYDPVPAIFKAKVVGGRIEINKLDSDTKLGIPLGDGLLSNAEYGIFTLSNEQVATITTNENGYAISGYLPSLGEFLLKETKASKGYELDRNVYRFIIDENNLLATVDVYEKVIKRDITLFKVFASSETGILKAEPNIKFNVYLKSTNNLYTSVTTDKDGYANLELPYGVWVFKQQNSTPDYEKVDDFEITVEENSDNTIYRLLSNAPIEAKLKVMKIDSETKEVIAKAGIKFKIKDKVTNEYVCQTITYPTAKKVCTFETDENGIIITPSTLVGNFILEEVEDQIVDGYTWNNEKIEFHIGDGSEFIVDPDFGVLLPINFQNERVKGKVEITKIGEQVVIKNNTFEYEEVKLTGVKIGLYANEDIYIGKTKKYSKDDLVATLITENGFVSIDSLELGKYYLKELETMDNYILDDKIYPFELVFKDQYTSLILNESNLKNYLVKGKLEFTKTDYTTSEGIPNTIIEIYTDKDELIFSGSTNENGKVIINDLFIGKFYIIEKEATTGYVLTDEKVLFEIKNNGEIVKAKMTNKKILGTLEIIKVDSFDNKPIPNTKIEIYNDKDELLFTELTNEEGKIIIENLEYGKYYLKEIESAEGYQLSNEIITFEIKKDKEIVKVEMTNDIIVVVPNTETSASLLPIIIYGAFLLGIVITKIIISSKKIKNKHPKANLILNLVIIFFTFTFVCGKALYTYVTQLEDTEKVEQFIINQQEEVEETTNNQKNETNEEIKETNYDYIGVLEIPKINVKRGFVSLNNKDNNVNKNIQVIEKSNMPNVANGNLIIAAHSGSGRVAFFKDLYKLEKNDIAYIYYENEKYEYKVVNIYDVEKTGKVAISRNKDKNVLTLITCRPKTNKQMVVIMELINRGAI